MTNTVYSLLPEDSTKTFGVFVGMFNKTAGTELTVKQAHQVDTLVQLYEGIKEAIAELKYDLSEEISHTTKSTKRKSFDALNIPELDQDVLITIYNWPGASRNQVAKKLGRRLSSICGAVNRLMEARIVFTKGTVHDEETNRDVEALFLNHDWNG